HLLERLPGPPVAVLDASGALLVANPPYAALMGDPSGWRGNQRNGVWRNLIGPPGRLRHTPQARREFEAAIGADLRPARRARNPPNGRVAHPDRPARPRPPPPPGAARVRGCNRRGPTRGGQPVP